MNLQTWLENAGKYSCLVICYLWIVADKIGIVDDKKEEWIYKKLVSGLDGLGDDFFVVSPERLMKSAVAPYFAINPVVYKKTINSIKEIEDVEYAALEFKSGNNSHFVVAKKGVVVYNSLDYSKCVAIGEPNSIRGVIFN